MKSNQSPPPVPAEPTARPWRLDSDTPSLQEVHSTIAVASGLGFWRKLLAFSGPGYLVAVGYMDPGNWATDLAGGSAFGYTLLSVILLSNLMAILLQCALRQARHRHRTRPGAGVPRPLLATGLVRAVDPLRGGDLRLRSRRSHRLGDRVESALRPPADLGCLPHGARCAGWSCTCRTEASATSRRWSSTLILTIGGCFFAEIIFSQPDVVAVLGGFLPRSRSSSNPRCCTSPSASSARR